MLTACLGSEPARAAKTSTLIGRIRCKVDGNAPEPDDNRCGNTTVHARRAAILQVVNLTHTIVYMQQQYANK